MHKSKGKEFDNVYLMLNHFDISTDEKRRLLYVAMTRAKKRLVIHYNGTFEAGMNLPGLTITSDCKAYALPDEIFFHILN